MAGTIPAKRPPVHFQREWSPDRAPRKGIPEVCLKRRAGVATRVFSAEWYFGKAALVTSRSGDTEGRARKGRAWEGRSTAAPPPLGGRSGGYNQAGCGEQHPRRALLAGLLLPAARGGVSNRSGFNDPPRTPRPHPATPARRKRSGGRGVKGCRGVILAGKLRDGRAG